VAQLSGHKNIESLLPHKSASEQHQHGMSLVLSGQSSSLHFESLEVFARSTPQPFCSPPTKQLEESLSQISEATKKRRQINEPLHNSHINQQRRSIILPVQIHVFMRFQDAIFSFFMALSCRSRE